MGVCRWTVLGVAVVAALGTPPGCGGGSETKTVTETVPATTTSRATQTNGRDDLTTIEVARAFDAAGLEAAGARPMTKDDYGFAPMAVEGTRFLIPSLGEDSGGRIMRYETEEDRDRAKAYYDELGQSSAAFFSWTFTNGLILVLINGDLPEAKARRYEEVLQTRP